MPYKPLSLPSGLDRSLEDLIRERVDPFLHDVRNMYLLPFGPDRNAEGGCNFPIANTLVGVLAGLSTVLTPNTRGKSTSPFMELIKDHYPDEPGFPGPLTKDNLADALWHLYRCPLEHALGKFDLYTQRKIKQIFGYREITRVRVDKGRITAQEIREVEDAADRGVRMPNWTVPTLRVAGTELRLTAKIFYWGVRQTVIKWAAAHNSRCIRSPAPPYILVAESVVSGATGPMPTKVDSGDTG